MRRNKKINIVMIFALIVMLSTQNVAFAFSTREKIEAEVRQEYANDPGFQKETQEYGSDWAEESLNHIIDRCLEKSNMVKPNSIPDAIQRVNVRNIQQTTEYNCGPTNVLIALYTAGRASRVSGSSNEAKIKTLEKDCGTTTNGSSYGDVEDALNKYMRSNKKNYISTHIKNNKNKMEQRIYDSLEQGYAALLNLNNSKLAYWDGYGSGHYVTAYYIDIDPQKDIIKVTDTYNGKLCKNGVIDTFGKHSLSANEVYGALYGKYVISYY